MRRTGVVASLLCGVVPVAGTYSAGIIGWHILALHIEGLLLYCARLSMSATGALQVHIHHTTRMCSRKKKRKAQAARGKNDAMVGGTLALDGQL